VNLALDDAMEPGQLLQFLDDWLATDRGAVNESFTFLLRREQRRRALLATRPPLR
jgi:hypothetical protein